MSGFQVLYDEESEEEEENRSLADPALSPRDEAWQGIPEPTTEDNIYVVRGKEKMKLFGEKVVTYGFKGKHPVLGEVLCQHALATANDFVP